MIGPGQTASLNGSGQLVVARASNASNKGDAAFLDTHTVPLRGCDEDELRSKNASHKPGRFDLEGPAGNTVDAEEGLADLLNHPRQAVWRGRGRNLDDSLGAELNGVLAANQGDFAVGTGPYLNRRPRPGFPPRAVASPPTRGRLPAYRMPPARRDGGLTSPRRNYR